MFINELCYVLLKLLVLLPFVWLSSELSCLSIINLAYMLKVILTRLDVKT
jgi:hypothetical protein